MVMGTCGTVGGSSGIPGPVGPPGPQGPPGRDGVLGPDTALGAFARYVMSPPSTWPDGQWSVLNFDVPEWDTHQLVTTGPNWQWHALFPGVYHLSSALCLDPLAGGPPMWALRVMRQGNEDLYQEFTGYTGHIAWLGHLLPGETLQVQIKPVGPTPTQIRSGPPRSCIVVAGCGSVP